MFGKIIRSNCSILQRREQCSILYIFKINQPRLEKLFWRGIRYTIPRKVNEHRGGKFDKALYPMGNLVEGCLNRKKKLKPLLISVFGLSPIWSREWSLTLSPGRRKVGEVSFRCHCLGSERSRSASLSRDRLTAQAVSRSAARAQIARERDTSMYEELR